MVAAYIETISVTTTNQSTTVVGHQPLASEPVAQVVMSLVTAKQLCMILRKQLKEVEDRSGTKITLPSESYSTMGVAPEDW